MICFRCSAIRAEKTKHYELALRRRLQSRRLRKPCCLQPAQISRADYNRFSKSALRACRSTHAPTDCGHTTTTISGTPLDITRAEIALEAFFPADAATAEALTRLAPAARQKQATAQD
jgi:hypothetical protein